MRGGGTQRSASRSSQVLSQFRQIKASSPPTPRLTMQVHPSRSAQVERSNARSDAQDLHSPPSTGGRRDERRASPQYDQYYDKPPHHPSNGYSQGNGNDRRFTEEEREQRAIEREDRRGGGRQRLTPERELGYGGRYAQQPQSGYGQDRGGYQGRGGPGGGGDDWLDS